jgi:hypothetical protein
MQGFKELSETLSKKITLSKHRLDCLSLLIVGLLVVNTTNLKKLCVVCDNGTQRSSKYRRMQRFFSAMQFDFAELSQFIVSLFFLDDEKLYLALDRTNWKYGKLNINILFLAVIYRGTAIPLLWTMLDKQGNSNTAERIHLINRFISVFGAARIGSLLGDREFIGKQWFEFLHKHGISFVIRIKSNTLVANKGVETHVARLFDALKVNEKKQLPNSRLVWGVRVFLSAVRSLEGELVILATMDERNDVINLYAKRWEIETLFSCLKGRGFNFEDTRITALDRIDKMVAVLAITFAWAQVTGQWYNENIKPITVKKHGRLERSVFRYGLDILQDTLFSNTKIKSNLTFILKLLTTEIGIMIKKPLGLNLGC